MSRPTPLRATPTVTLALDVEAGRPADALDLIRRVRAFAEEMRAAGLVVEVTGALQVVVRAASPGFPEEDPTHA